jgi:hypothetical protein
MRRSWPLGIPSFASTNVLLLMVAVFMSELVALLYQWITHQ